ncbi:acyl carrier protein [Belliella kenyensis]|uniref:Acyl carrier protein n=1 Tax=Belliella kenyensis TaxID=1472724 RepID=A0ABV8EL12_9BACT|nr:acyl carrier protein [Belliella kenyensis]MCH7400321.1 acyl carrier protein [Belliella kenyensis]MDN3604661.1 acyl carrier protein [Belliella kenyensis]
MKGYKELKTISRVFHDYGIVLTGRKKFARFDQDLKMDKVFVMGLIFELEYQLQKEIADEQVKEIHAPVQLIELLMN